MENSDRKNCCGASLRHFNGVLMEMETDPPPVAHSPFLFPPPRFFPFFPFSLSLKLSHSRKNPITEILGAYWKRDSLWNVFGVTQRQCLSCPSANRMQCAGERREIRTDNGKWERPPKKGNQKCTGQYGEKEEKTAMRLMMQTWHDDPERPKKAQCYGYSIVSGTLVQEIEGKYYKT